MKKNNIVFKVFGLAALITFAAFASAVNPIELKEKIPQLMEKANIPGLAIAVINNGEPVWINGFGRKNVNKPGKVSFKTVFEAASLTKPLFAYLVIGFPDQVVTHSRQCVI